MNDFNKCLIVQKEDYLYEVKYPIPSNNEQAKMIFEAMQEDTKLKIENQIVL